MNVNTWTVRDTLGQPSKFSQQQACALALELFESLLRIASEIEDAETFASEEQGDRGRVIVYQDHVEMMKEHIERADTILADVLATKGGE